MGFRFWGFEVQDLVFRVETSALGTRRRAARECPSRRQDTPPAAPPLQPAADGISIFDHQPAQPFDHQPSPPAALSSAAMQNISLNRAVGWQAWWGVVWCGPCPRGNGPGGVPCIILLNQSFEGIPGVNGPRGGSGGGDGSGRGDGSGGGAERRSDLRSASGRAI